jgi:hypothetical protein
MSPRLRLVLAAVAFFGWLGYLSYAAVTKSRAPVVSHAQAAAADAAVVAELDGSQTVKVVEKLWGDAPSGSVEVVNLREPRGYTGPGPYLLFLAHRGEAWAVVGLQRSPGTDLSNQVSPPIVYAWSDAVRMQVEKMKP